MKNLPEEDAFKQLENRLANYEEVPDEAAWGKIRTVVPVPINRWLYWGAATATILLLVWIPSARVMKQTGVPTGRNTVHRNLQHENAGHEHDQRKKVKRFDSLATITAENRVRQDLSTARERSEGVMSNGQKPESDQQSQVKRSGSTPALTQTFPMGDSSGHLPAATSPDVSNFDKIRLPDSTLSVSKSDNEKNLVVTSLNQDIDRKLAMETKSDTTRPAIKKRIDSAKSEKPKKPENLRKKKKIGFDMFALLSPSLSFQDVSPRKNDGVVVNKFGNPGVLSGDRSGVSLQTGIQGKISSRLEFLAGISFYYQSQRLHYSTVSPDKTTIQTDNNGYVITPVSEQQSVTYKMFNAGVMAGGLYTLQRGIISHKIGMTLSFQEGFYHGSDNVFYKNAGSYYLNYGILYRMEITIDRKLRFMLQPSVGHTLRSSESLNAPFTLTQYQAGFGFGLIRHF